VLCLVLQYFHIFPVVVDAYAAWCGPCKAIVSTLKRIKNELGDDLLLFATVSVICYDVVSECVHTGQVEKFA
jgi:thiol-disulfide isomerase/thioredoxin